jgi:hypothetical protein
MQDGKTFMMSYYYEQPITGDSAMLYFSKYDFNGWKDLDSSKLTPGSDGFLDGYKFGNLAMWGSSENEMYSSYMALYKYDGSKWMGLGGIGYGHLIRGIKGYSKNGLFYVGDHGWIGYYDGNKWGQITEYNQYIVQLYDVMPFDDDVFITAIDHGMGFIVHGRKI